MARGAYIGVGGTARKIKRIYVGVGGVARRVAAAYIGVGGVARLCHLVDNSTGAVVYSTVTMQSNFTVPIGVRSIAVTAIAGGGDGSNYIKGTTGGCSSTPTVLGYGGGSGGKVNGTTYNVTPGSVHSITVGPGSTVFGSLFTLGKGNNGSSSGPGSGGSPNGTAGSGTTGGAGFTISDAGERGKGGNGGTSGSTSGQLGSSGAVVITW